MWSQSLFPFCNFNPILNFKINSFKSREEFLALQTLRVPEFIKNSTRRTSSHFVPVNILKKSYLPEKFTWQNKNVITPVKNQAQCGSCWAFSTTGALEGAYAKKYGNLQSFSEQQLVDCCETCFGCNGGLPEEAFKYTKNNGLLVEDQYKYIGTVTLVNFFILFLGQFTCTSK